MGLLERIKSALGVESSDREEGTRSSPDVQSGQDVAVTVEHEPETTAEDAVKGTDTDLEGEPTTDSPPEGSSAPQPVEPAEGEEAPDVEGVSEAEPDAVEESRSGTEDAEPVEEADTGAGEPAVVEDAESTPAESPGVQSIKGIGPAYAERLAEADVQTVADLAAADAATVAETTGIAESRVSTWIERAGE